MNKKSAITTTEQKYQELALKLAAAIKPGDHAEMELLKNLTYIRIWDNI
jgi:hypothetical protein